jgi:hypothetical protein
MGTKPMSDARFWALMDAGRGGEECDGDALEAALAACSEDEILAFQQQVDRRMAESYRADLWGAAYLINGGCSDDGFDYFRGWLISRGQRVFDAALAQPDSLAKAAGEGDVECEDVLSVASNAYEKKTGREDFYERVAALERLGPQGLIGDLETWSEDGEGQGEKLAALYPKLWAKFGCDEEE